MSFSVRRSESPTTVVVVDAERQRWPDYLLIGAGAAALITAGGLLIRSMILKSSLDADLAIRTDGKISGKTADRANGQIREINALRIEAGTAGADRRELLRWVLHADLPRRRFWFHLLGGFLVIDRSLFFSAALILVLADRSASAGPEPANASIEKFARRPVPPPIRWEPQLR